LIADQLARLKIAGSVVVVVKDDAILFARGYGYANVENHRSMTADSTLVRPGSISKLSTGIAVMQLVEQGRLDLDRDVNEYLDFHIPISDRGVPVTLRRLMTPRAGFEGRSFGTLARSLRRITSRSATGNLLDDLLGDGQRTGQSG